MRYFVTGATTSIGRAVVRLLVDQGHELVTVSRKPDRARETMDRGIDVMYGDLFDKQSLRDAMHGVDGVFHMAAHYQMDASDHSHALRQSIEIKRDFKAMLQDLKEMRTEARRKGMSVTERLNVEGTRTVLEVMKELRIPRGVYTGSLAVYSDTRGKMVNESTKYRGPWKNAWERSMWKAQHEVVEPLMHEGTRLPLVVLQPGLVYGPGDVSWVHAMLRALLLKQLTFTPKKTAFCWTYVDDVAKAHVTAMEKGRIGETYILAGPAHTVSHVVEQAAKLAGVRTPKRELGALSMRVASFGQRMLGALKASPETYTSAEIRSIVGTSNLGAHDKAKYALGFEPRTLHDGLRYTLYYEMSQLGMLAYEHAQDEIKVLALEPEQF